MNRLPLLALAILICLSNVPSAFAGPKEEFIKAVVEQKSCKLPPEKAEELATPGRTGNIVKFTNCAEATIDLGGGCKITCTKSGATIGN